MKISVEDGVVVCTLENRNREFMSTSYDCFDGFYKGKLKIHLFTHDNDSPTERAKEEARVIKRILNYAADCGVEVDQSVYARYEGLWAVIELDRLAREEARRAQMCHNNWLRLCNKGCGNCKYLAVCGDDHYCKASGDLLDEKNMPAVVNGVHYMFNYQAFPSENCLYKI